MRMLASLLGLLVTMTALAATPTGLAPYRAEYQLSYGPMGMAAPIPARAPSRWQLAVPVLRQGGRHGGHRLWR